MTKENTKSLLLEKGAEIILEKGFNNTGIQDILKAAQVPKGSFYYYFKSKEDFGLDLIDFYANNYTTMMEEYFKDPSTSPINRFKRYVDDWITYFDISNCKGGCPIGNMAQEMGDINESFRIKLKETFDRMKTHISECLREAQEKGEISESLDPDETADFIFDSLEGALLRMKVTKSTTPLKRFYKMISNILTKE